MSCQNKKSLGIKVLVWGILIYAVVFLVISAFVGYKMDNTLTAKIVTLIAFVVLAFFAGKSAKLSSAICSLVYSVGLLLVVVILDLLVTVRFTGWEVFLQWELWVGYVLILGVPFLTIKKEKEHNYEIPMPVSTKPPLMPEEPKAPEEREASSAQEEPEEPASLPHMAEPPRNLPSESEESEQSQAPEQPIQ